MASLNSIFPRFALRALPCGLFLALYLSGCTQAPSPPAPAPTTAASSTPTLPTDISATPAGELSYAEINARYAATVPESDNGWPIVKPLLKPAVEGQAAPWDRYEALAISDKPADLAVFDKEVLPKLKEGFSKPTFFEPHQLLSGRDPLSLHYRQLRTLCDQIAERSDLLWEAGNKGEALELLRLPLSLSKALQRRPETVSLNLFSSAYASSALRDIADWTSTNSLKEPELSQASELLAEFRPSYSHLTDCLSVDFAQLDNSIKDGPTRTEVLGLGMASPEDLKLWSEQVGQLRADAQKLYEVEGADPRTFNQAVLKMSPQVHGLVLEYPELTTMQKHAFATYLATELALALERMRLSDIKAPDEKALLEAVFAGDAGAQQAATELLTVQYPAGQVPKTFAINGRGKVFALAAPDGKITFYQR